MAQENVAYVGETSTLAVEELPWGDTYSWELYTEPTVPNFDFVANTGSTTDTSYAEFVGGTNTGTTVEILWKEPGLYFFKVNAWNITGCTNNLRVGMIRVLPAVAKILEPAPICSGETCTLTVELSGYKDSEWEYTVEFAPVSGSTATRTVVGTATADLGATKATDYLEIPLPNLTETTIFRVISVTNRTATSEYTNDTPTKPVTLIVYPPPKSTEIYKKR